MNYSQAVEAFFVSRAPRKESAHTTAAYRRDLAAVVALVAWQSNVDTEELRCDKLTAAVMRRAFADFAANRAKSSIARAWSVWNTFFGFCVSEGLIDGNPMSGVARPKAPTRAPKPLAGNDTPERLLSALVSGARQARHPWPQRDVAVVAMLLLTGVRSGELLACQVGDVAGDSRERRLVVRGGKGDNDRVVPVELPLESLLDDYAASRRQRFPTARWPLSPREPLFVDHRGEALTRNQLQYLVRQCYRYAGIDSAVQKGALVHALRHTFATRVGQSGASAMEVMELLGHRSLAASQGYIGVTARELREAAGANPTYGALDRLRRGDLARAQLGGDGVDGGLGGHDEG